VSEIIICEIKIHEIMKHEKIYKSYSISTQLVNTYLRLKHC